MRQFFKKTGLVFILFYGLLWAMEKFVDYRLQNSNSIIYNDWNLLMKGKINTPMVFLGNSRTEAHFDTEIIEKNTGISSYNLGVAGASLTVEQLRWKSYLAHNKPPKIVVQNIDLYALTNKPLADKKQYLPYYNEPTIYDKLKKIDPTVVYEKYIPMSKYRGFEFQVIKAFGFPNVEKGKKVKGYNKHCETWNHDFIYLKKSLHGKKIKYSKAELALQLNALQNIIRDCNKLKSKLILVWMPQYNELSDLQEPTLSQMKKQMKKIAQQNKNVVFWDFSTQPFNHDKQFFYNSFHMNDVGVAVFCKQFSDSLNVYLKQPIR
ncbi:hypothetical protein [Flavobacterium sp.]|uniref:hypothetical protein n=1 Tax=Flavobacterium sp. TaxID=239 RepID=UPI00286C1178|nr:hypothetical protein [Flavobacterium sp.]